MAQYTVSQLSAIFKTALEEPIKDAVLGEQLVLQNIIKKDIIKNRRYNWAQNKYEIPVEIGYSPNAGGRAELSNVPPVGAGERIKLYGRLKKLINRTAITYELKLMQEVGQPAIQDVIEAVRNDLERGLRDRLNMMLIGHPSSLIEDATYGDLEVVAVCDGVGEEGDTITLRYHKGETVYSKHPGGKWLRPGMTVRIGTAAQITGGTADVCTIVSVSEDYTQCTVTPAITWEDGDLICPASDSEGYSNAVIYGLNYHLGNSGMYEGADRDTYPQIRANVKDNGGTLRALDEPGWDRAISAPREYGSGGKIDAIFCNMAMVRKWKAVIAEGSSRIYNPGEPWRGGDLAVRMSALTPIDDPMMLPGTFFMIDTSKFEFVYAELFKFEEIGGSIFIPAGTLWDQDAYEIRLRFVGNLIGKNPRANVQFCDLKEDDQT